MKSRVIVAYSCLLVLSAVRAGEPEVAFLRERVSFSAPYGVTAFPPGTRVTVISRHGAMVTVKSENQQFEVSADQLTTDPEAARRLSARDAGEQQAAHQQIVQQQAKRDAEVREAQRQAQSASPPDPRAAVEAQIRDIQKHRDRLQIELDRVHDEQKGMPPPNSTQYGWSRHYRRDVPISIRSSPNAEKLAQREKELRKQIDDLNYKEKLLRWQAK